MPTTPENMMTAMDVARDALLDASGEPRDGYLAGPGVPGMVSVVIPTYNRAEVVRASIESVLAQTHRNIEVIVVDDGSRDHTRQVVESYGDPVRYVYQANAGVSAARNTGFVHARGEFVALLDSDDQFLPWKLEAQLRVLERHPEVGMVWTDMTAVNEHGRVLHQTYLRKFYDAHEVARIEDVLARPGTLRDHWPDAPVDVAPDAPVLLGFRSAAHAEAAAIFGTDPFLATDDGSVGHSGLVTELLMDRLDGAEVFSCGPPPMLEAVRAICAERDVPAQLALESGMACGFGACFGCVVPTKQGYVRLCVDGPVLEASELETALTAGAGH